MLPGTARSATGSNVTLKLASAGQNAAKGKDRLEVLEA
jgi:hypothetical protein